MIYFLWLLLGKLHNMIYTVAISIADKNHLRWNIVFEWCKWGILAFEKIEEKEGLEVRIELVIGRSSR